MKLPSAVQLDPACHVGHLQGCLPEAMDKAVAGDDRSARAEVQALAGERVGQRAEGPDGLQLAACPVDVTREALRAPTRRESLRVAPGTLEEPGA
jgi:hypothetical protein